MTLLRFKELINAVSEVMHLVKPLLFEAVLFFWATYEMCRFALGVIAGH